ncbi:hypothetical protein RclHR1_01130016 [Rhizophagus clarus]|uniref:Uncharacterized protein n=1 Tax=Rhizophagus clarus TaxID=94130 RepID=A0A2Z6QJ09_9GLOM|nr:hypothetical protein RclHR1_01130016 [Rhizophagus clarus]GES78437.1 hypothetical protein GLOIN_2v1719369 [Rhizophagus clarus]
MPPKKRELSLSSSPKEIIDTYKEDFHACEAKLNPEPLPGKELLEPVTTLLKKPAKNWTEQDILPIAKLLAGRVVIDGTGENLNGANAFGRIAEEFENFILGHPEFRALIDPVYVVIDITTTNNAPPANINMYPHNVAANLLPGSTYVYRFDGPGADANAQHFIGFIQSGNHGLRAYVFHTTFPAVYY